MDYCNICGRQVQLYKISKIVLRDGDAYSDVYLDVYATPLPGFIAIRKSRQAAETVYINAANIAEIHRDDEGAQDMPGAMVEPVTVNLEGLSL